ncbi:hypothetical protein BPAE_0118g00170 [Botrytis paeoniae]|uniref:Uncharacterized protein n=1 Tax=Botrytis paeoniae TaxID=278948 RepID=A0A4Z1FK56_9HELO|nr:hypothetical protein BPAE_0118g00170 [Botrytis paeoniae]
MSSKAEPLQDKQEPDNNQEYIFKRDYKSSMRPGLNYNHFLIKEVAGYLLLPVSPCINPICELQMWALEPEYGSAT